MSEKIDAARALCYTLFWVPPGYAPRDPVRRLERHGYVWDDAGGEWTYNPDEAIRRGQRVDYGQQP